MKGLILFIAAIILSGLLLPSFMTLTVIILIITFKFDKLNFYLHDLAYVIDVYGNVGLQFVLNEYLLSKDSKDLFGYKKDTISKVLGKNVFNSTKTKNFLKYNSYSKLSFLGDILVVILSESHCLDAIKE